MSYAPFPFALEDAFDADEETRVRRIHTTSSIHRIPTANAIVRSSVRPAVPLATIEALPRRESPTVVTFRTRAARRMAWPVFVCGFLAGVFGGVALMKSPFGKRPLVQHVVKKTNLIVNDAIRP